MPMNSWLLESLIRDRLSDARDRAAKDALLRSVKRTPRARWHAWLGILGALIVAAFLATGCGPSTMADVPPTSGRRVQGASMIAEGSFPVRLGAYELLFATTPSTRWQARRAALLVDLAGGQGLARGFVEAGRAGEGPMTYTAEGWARQREIDGERLTVLELQLNYLGRRETPSVALDAGHRAPLAIRVVVHEGSDDVTLTRRR